MVMMTTDEATKIISQYSLPLINDPELPKGTVGAFGGEGDVGAYRDALELLEIPYSTLDDLLGSERAREKTHERASRGKFLCHVFITEEQRSEFLAKGGQVNTPDRMMLSQTQPRSR